MTVCVAAMCKWNDKDHLIAVADRLLTDEDAQITYEPQTKSKIFLFKGRGTVALQAGDDDVCSTLAAETQRIVLERKIESVDGIARIYSEQFIALRRRRAEIRFLAPLNLDDGRFITQQNTIRPEIAAERTHLLTHATLCVSAIIAGIGPDGESHIYKVDDPGIESCEDGIGFAAVGAGAQHAEFLLMQARYDARRPANDAIALAYWAKKRAEFSPSVGAFSDVFVIRPEGTPLRAELASELEQQYFLRVKEANHALSTAIDNLALFAKKLISNDDDDGHS